jgi:hypothetical protein
MAKKNLEAGYERWREAYGTITWKEYLQRIKLNNETGQWAREVAELLYNESVE